MADCGAATTTVRCENQRADQDECHPAITKQAGRSPRAENLNPAAHDEGHASENGMSRRPGWRSPIPWWYQAQKTEPPRPRDRLGPRRGLEGHFPDGRSQGAIWIGSRLPRFRPKAASATGDRMPVTWTGNKHVVGGGGWCGNR